MSFNMSPDLSQYNVLRLENIYIFCHFVPRGFVSSIYSFDFLYILCSSIFNFFSHDLFEFRALFVHYVSLDPLYFYINTKDLGTEVEFDPPEEATKAQIRTAFKKSLNQSKFNRKILSEFVELVA